LLLQLRIANSLLDPQIVPFRKRFGPSYHLKYNRPRPKTASLLKGVDMKSVIPGKLLQLIFFATTFACLFVSVSSAYSQTTSFTYQGRLTDTSIPASGSYSMEFRLFSVATGGTVIATQAHPNVSVTNGVFTVPLDFSNNFDGGDRYLEIVVGGTVLTPRQQVRSTPYAIRTVLAGNALNLGGTAAAQFVQNSDPRLTDARPPDPGSPNYIQNQDTFTQSLSNFRISGTGTAFSLNATGHFAINGNRVLSTGFFTTLLGIDAGSSNSGAQNTFLGNRAGQFNTSGAANTFVGFQAGAANNVGSNNVIVGNSAGNDLVGSFNSIFGAAAGGLTSGTNISLFGMSSSAANGLSNASAFGSRAFVGQSNSLVLGSINGVNGAAADTNVGIGTSVPARRLHVSSGSSGAAPLSSADFVLEDDASAFQHFLTADDVESGILFGDPTDSIGGGIIFNNASFNNGINFRAGGNTTRMTLTGGGFLGIGTTTPGDMLDVNGDIRVGSGSTGCVKDSDGTVIAGTCSSDSRLKRDISPFPRVLDKMSMLKPVHFYWDEKQQSGKVFGKSLSFGLIAQDVEKVLPELIAEDEKGYKAVRYNKLPLLTLQAVKDLKEENDILKKRLSETEAQIAALKKLVCAQNPQAEICKE
jgi:hypothetical protein